MTANGDQRGVTTWGGCTGDALLVAQTQKHPQYPSKNKQTMIWPQEEKHPKYKILHTALLCKISNIKVRDHDHT